MKSEKSKIDDNELKLFGFVMENSPDIIYIYDIIEKRNVFSNKSIANILGYTVKEIQEMGENLIPFLMHPDDLGNYLNIICPKYQEARDNEWIEHDYRMKNKSGEWRWLNSKEIIYKRKDNGTPSQIFGILSDVNNYKTVKIQLQDALTKAEENENRFNELFRNMNNGCAIYKAVDDGNDFVFVDFNKAGERIEKTKKDNLIGKRVTEVFPGVIEFGLHDIFKKVYKTGKAEHFPLSFYKDDKIQGWRDNYIYKLRNGDIVSIYYDRTKEKQAESDIIKAKEIAEENEQKYKRLTENAPDVIYRMSLTDGQYKYVSPSSINIFGYTPEEFYNRPMLIANAIHPDFAEYFKTEWARLQEGKLSPTYEYKIFNKEGKEKWLHQRNVLIRDNSNKPIAIEGIVTDITYRKETEQALIENEKLLSTIAENYPNSYLSIIEKNFTISFTSGQEFVKQNLNPDDYVGLGIEKVFGENTEYVKENYQKTFNGEETSFELFFNDQYQFYKTVPLYNEKGIITRILSVAENITERKKKEIEFQVAKEKAEESNRLKTEFINNMSHEIRTPMNGIMGFSGFLNDMDLAPEKQKYYTRIIQNSAKQLLHIIDDILEISSLSTKQVKVDADTFSLNDMLMELFSIFNLRAQEKKIPLYLKKGLPDEKSSLTTDKSKLTKILMNLIDNAIKYTNSGFIEIGYTCNKDSIQLYVQDTGIGIEAKNQESIFERFTQEEKEISRKIGGLGLGLSIAKENAELIGGTISLDSKKGKGSTFYLTIPFSAIELISLPDIISDSSENAVKIAEYTILVAEDEEVNYLYIETVFKSIPEYAIKIIHARNGQEAVDACKENSSIDLVLMDIKMPVMNGLEATTVIKSFNSSLPIIAQTAYSTDAEKQKAIDSGCSDFITKPIDRSRLVETFEKFVVLIK